MPSLVRIFSCRLLGLHRCAGLSLQRLDTGFFIHTHHMDSWRLSCLGLPRQLTNLIDAFVVAILIFIGVNPLFDFMGF